MSTPSPTPGFVLWCDHEGKVLEVICDTLGVSQRLNFEQTLPLLLDRASLGKTLNFLLETRIQGAALDWELNMPLDGQTLTLHFVGVRMHDRLLIVAAQNKTNLMQLYEAMMELNNAQINALRTTVKGQSQLALSGPAPAAWSQQDDAAYNTITQFNNELVNLQRELAKKNAELERLNAQKNQFLGMASHDLRTRHWVRSLRIASCYWKRPQTSSTKSNGNFSPSSALPVIFCWGWSTICWTSVPSNPANCRSIAVPPTWRRW